MVDIVVSRVGVGEGESVCFEDVCRIGFVCEDGDLNSIKEVLGEGSEDTIFLGGEKSQLSRRQKRSIFIDQLTSRSRILSAFSCLPRRMTLSGWPLCEIGRLEGPEEQWWSLERRKA